MAKKAIALIEIEGGQEITRYTQIKIEQKLFGHHKFSIQVPIESIEGEGNFTFSKSKAIIGKTIHISLESDLILDVKSPPFIGVITKIGFTRSFGSSNELLIEGKSTTALMDNGENHRSFSEKGLADIVNDIMDAYPENVLSCNPDPVFTGSIPYLVQYKESDFLFLQRIARRYGEWIYFNGSELVFGKPELPDAIPLLLGRDLFDFHLKLSLAATNYQSNYYNYKKSEVYQRPSLDSEISNYDAAYGELAFKESGDLFKSPPLQPFNALTADQKELDDHVERHVDQMSSGMVYITGNSDHIALGIGRSISVTGAKGEDIVQGLENFGEFIITKVDHYIGGDGDYHNTFDAVPKEVGVPPLNEAVKRPYAQPEPAIVKENIDPDELGRIRVQLYWQKENEMTPWIRLVSSHAGQAGGFFVIPEKGDEVMVNYQHHHPDRPFTVGSVYNHDAKPAANWSEEDNNIKAIKTKSGNEIIFNDKENTEEIKILNKGGTNSIVLTMSAGGSISISTPNQMNLNGKNITIVAEETLKINAKNMIVETEENFSVTATKKIIAKSTETTDIIAKTNLKVESTTGTLTAKSKSNLTVESTAGTLTAMSKGLLKAESTGSSAEIQGNTGITAESATGPLSLKAATDAQLEGGATAKMKSDGPVIVKGIVVQLN